MQTPLHRIYCALCLFEPQNLHSSIFKDTPRFCTKKEGFRCGASKPRGFSQDLRFLKGLVWSLWVEVQELNRSSDFLIGVHTRCGSKVLTRCCKVQKPAFIIDGIGASNCWFGCDMQSRSRGCKYSLSPLICSMHGSSLAENTSSQVGGKHKLFQVNGRVLPHVPQKYVGLAWVSIYLRKKCTYTRTRVSESPFLNPGDEVLKSSWETT